MLNYKIVLLFTNLLIASQAVANDTYWINAGDRALSNNRIELSIDFYSRAIENNPKDPVGYLKRSVAYRAKGELIKSVEDMQVAYAIDPLFMKRYLNGRIDSKGFVDRSSVENGEEQNQQINNPQK